ncbi:hypothetical protein VM1G_01573 [Cytospora mali]|uniref:Uncharacterized protein n=1 Tax=Cytospora mali TaxID=578113 RepID=A0A194VSV3_CYTMA|nr:hypothetical protein VM1G_01573 [Valsa mali]
MALTIKHLNTDSSFLLTFEPLISKPVPGYEPEPFHILLDPWIAAPSKVFHPKISLTTQKESSCISSLNELPRPDLVIISQHKSDHCNEPTLKQISPAAKTVILAEPSAAKVIRAWKHFDRQNVLTLEKWEGPHASGIPSQSAVTRVPVPSMIRGGEPGEVTVAFIPQRRDLSGVHTAIGITYRPPPMIKLAQSPLSQRKFSHTSRTGALPFPMLPRELVTPPATLRSQKSYFNLPTVSTEEGHPPRSDDTGSPPAPTSPILSLRSVRSASTLIGTALTTVSSLSYTSAQRTLSVIFSPHGIVFEGNLASYATSHLVNEAALPLTALLHCFDIVSNPWWRGGSVLLGAPTGKEIAFKLGAMCWVSCHEEPKDVKAPATGWLKTRKRWRRFDVERVVAGEAKNDNCKGECDGNETEERLSRTTTITDSPAATRCCSKGAGHCGNRSGKETQVVTLGSGEEVILTSEGVWNVDRRQQQGQLGVSDAAGMAVPPGMMIPPESLAEAKARRRKRVAFHPLGEVITTSNRR